MKMFLSVSLSLSLLFPAILLAEDWTSDNFPIVNFSFEEYHPDTHTFDYWQYDTQTMDPEAFDQCLMPSLHYTACAHIVENEIGQYQESCYLQNTFISAEQTRYFNGKPCYLVAFVKCADISSTTGGGVFAEVYLPGGSVNTYYTSQMLTGEHNWCKLIVPFTFPSVTVPPIPSQQIQIRVGLRNATGEVWIDYVQIVQMETTVEGALYTDLENPSFDYTPGTLWGWTPYPTSKIGITADATNHMNGPISAKFSVTGSQPPEQTAYLSQNVSTDIAAHTYYASAFVKTDSLQSMSVQHPGAKLHIIYPGLNWYSQSIVGSQKWTRIQGTFDKPAVNMPSPPDLTLKLETTAYAGTAWFDWVTLKLNPVQNPGFNNWHGLSPPPDLMVWYGEGEGTAGYSTDYSHSVPSCGKIYNSDDHFDTALTQLLLGDGSPSLREGATYLLTGWIKTALVDPLSEEPSGDGATPGVIPEGAFVDVAVYKDNKYITLATSKPLVGSTSEWQEFSLCFSLPLDYFIEQTDDLYSMKNDGITTFDDFVIRCRLSKASGTAYFDDVNLVELEPTEDLATVVPQPQADQSFGYFSDPLVGFNPSKVVTIYYTPDSSPDPELGDTYQFSANNLQQELNRAFYECTGDTSEYSSLGWEGIKYNYPISDAKVVALTGTVTSLAKPCIILGDPSLDGSTGHLFQNELLKRGMVLPQDISPEGYIMQIDQETILIAASDSVIINRGNSDSALTKGAGSFYGTETLLQMLDIEQRSITPINCPGGVTYLPNKVVAPACYIYDYPDMVWRGQMSYIGWWGKMYDDEENYDWPKWNIYQETGFAGVNHQEKDNDITNNKKLFAQQMARFKMNRLSIFSTIFFFLKAPPQDTPPVHSEWNNSGFVGSLFDYCRKLHIEPIPMLGDWNNALLRHNGNCLECMIFDSQYIDDMGLVPGPNDYYSVEPGDRYPYPMPQPSWEFTVGNVINNYFGYNTVSVWDKTTNEYKDLKTMDYRVYNKADFPVRVEVWNEEQNIWDPPLTNLYTLHNVGLNDGDTSYYRFSHAGFYGDEQADWAYITFDPSLNGKKVRVSYSAPINYSLIDTNYGSTSLPQQMAAWTCLSDFDNSAPPDPLTEDTPTNWTAWSSRDIWYVALYEMMDWLKPRYIDIQHCEMWVMHTDKKCQYLRGLTPNYTDQERYPAGMHTWEHNAWNYGHEIEYLRQKIAYINSILSTNTQMMLYADMLDSHNGRYAEGRCRWNWYAGTVTDSVHTPDSDDELWKGYVGSHDIQYYKPAMGGMGGWTWDTRPNPDGLTCNTEYGMKASRYITKKDTIICREWGYQAGYFDDRDPENVILWQDKFKDRFDTLMDQGFTNFVGDCAGYALGLEGGYWGGIRFRCRDESAKIEGPAGIGGNNLSYNQLDGTNLKWVQMNYYLSGLQDPDLNIHMYLEVYNLDPRYAGPDHIDRDYGTGCHLDMVQNGWGYADDMHVTMNGTYDLTPDIYNSLFEYEFPAPADPHGEVNWNPTFDAHDSWLLDNYYPNTGDHCCKFLINNNLYEYSLGLKETTYNERHHVDQNKEPDTLNFSVYLRSLKLEALRHINPKIWADITYNYPHQEKILGLIDTSWVWGGVRNYSSVPTAADWMWFRNYPVSPLIKYMYYDPFYMFMGDRATHPNDTYPPNAPYPRDTESWTEP